MRQQPQKGVQEGVKKEYFSFFLQETKDGETERWGDLMTKMNIEHRLRLVELSES